MRVPTFRQYQEPVQLMQRQSEALQRTQLQLTQGLRILKPSDDPVGAVKVLNLSANIGMVEQFDRNGAIAQAALEQQDAVLGDVNEALQRIRELTVQGMNATLHDSARADLAVEIDQRMQELLSLANTRDANGEYLYSGGMGDVIPFVEQGGSVVYQGDQTSRQVQVGDGVQLVLREAGDAAFMSVPAGDGTIDVKASAANRGTLLVGKFAGSQAFVPDTYSITFTAASGGGWNYSVTDSATPTPTVVGSGVYQAGGSITFNGVQMQLSGAPVDGDVITVQPSQPQSMFAMVKSISTALRMPGGNGPQLSKLQNVLAQSLGTLDRALDTVNDQRASVGARLNRLENVTSINEDFRLQLDTLKSNTQDLDFAEAISRFNQQVAALQAAQEAYKKTSSLSLFNYL